MAGSEQPSRVPEGGRLKRWLGEVGGSLRRL